MFKHKHEFPLEDNLCYLNHAAVAPWPQRSFDAVQAFARNNLNRGATDYLKWVEVESELRSRIARLINAPSVDDIALVKNTSEALSMIAYGLEWKPGDNIVSFNNEFPSNRIVWESLHDRGVSLILVDEQPFENAEDRLLEHCNERTRLVSVSSVQYASGFRADVQRIGAFCRENGILFSIDAIQSIGADPLDAQICHADFVAADGHKWMLGPEGLGFFYSRPESRDLLRLNEYGWHMLETVGDYDNPHWKPARSARRFECGSPNMLSTHALNASLSLLDEVGMHQVKQLIHKKTSQIIHQLGCIKNVRLLSPDDPDQRAGIITFQIDGHHSPSLYQALMKQNVICACRGGGIRFSPHFYTPDEVIDRAFERLDSCLKSI